MVHHRLLLAAGALALVAGCSKSSEDTLGDNVAIEQPPSDDNAVENAAENIPAPAPAATTPEAARKVVTDYGALVAAGSLAQASKYWSDAANAKEFAASLEDYPEVKVKTGTPTGEEGAAGSVFITVPMTLDLTLRSGSPYTMQCEALMRRVNDVDGSTEEQRRWRIQSIDC